VYWRRRLLVLLGVVAVIVIIVLIIVRPGGGPAAAPSHSPAATTTHTTPNPDPSFSSSGKAGACDPSVVTLTPITDAASYAANAQPQLSMSITNSGAKACTLDVGTKAQDYVITSGADSIWNSADCQQNPESDVRTIEAGKTLTTTPFAWDRTRSSKDTCTGNRPAVVGGGASYHLRVKVGDITSSSTKQFVLQ
jgi:hypothetical protein